MITLYYNGTSIQVLEDDSSFRYKTIMGENSITLKFSLNEAIDFPVGTYIVFENITYTLTSPEKWSRRGNDNIEYTMVLEGVQSSLDKYKLRNPVDGRLKFSMNATPAEFLQMLVTNLNQAGRETGWTGVCNIKAENKTIEFNHDYLSSALTAITQAFETEYEITDEKVIRLGKVEYNKANPLPLAYGRGNGFKPNTGRSNTDNSKPVEILYVQGGERNIDRSTYGSSELHLPKGGRLEYEGVTYEADAEGLFIKKADVEPQYKNEDSFDGSEIYPKRVGEVSSVEVVDVEKHFYDFVDSSIPDRLNYNDYLINGETMTVIFQTGMLAGKEFEISKYIHTEDGQPVRKFEIVPQEIDGITMPDNTWKPAAKDKYAIFGCTLPESYINDEENQKGAEWDLFREAARYLKDHSDFKFTFTGELQGKWARENWVEGLSVSSKLIVGGYIRFTDNQFAPNGVDIRIVGVKTFLCDPYAPTIEISNSIASPSSISSELRRPDALEVELENSYRKSIGFTKRRWRDAAETMQMLEGAMLENFTGRISPIAINTMQMLVGDESLQFVFVDGKTAPQTIVSHTESWNNTTKEFTIGAGILKHMTLGISTIAGDGARTLNDFKYWTLSQQVFNLSAAGLEEKSYYLYAKCSKTAETGVFVASETPIALEGVAGYYHLLLGVLNSEYEGDRSYVRLYGFTEITGGRITTDKIVSSNGNTYFDLEGNKIGGFIDFVDGLISGLIGVGNTQGINAGLNGDGNTNTDIRFWAGQTAENRASAPFRVQHDGKMFASDAEVSGTINADKGILNNVTVQGSMSSPIVLWRTNDIKVSGNSYIYTRYPYSDAASSAAHKYCFANFYKSGSSVYTRTIFCNTESPSVGTPYWFYPSTTEQAGTVTEVIAVNVINGNADGSGRHDNVILPQLAGTGTPQVITAEQFSWDASNIGRCVRLLNYKYASEPDGNIKLTAPSGKYFYECGYQTSSIRLSREYVELYGYGAEGVFYGWIVVNRQDIKTRGEYGMPWKVIYQGCVNPYASVQIERLWDANLEIQGEGSVDYGYQKLATGRFKITLPKLLSKYNPATGETIYEKCWHVIVVPRSCLVDGTAPSQDHITCGFACLAAKGHENGKSYFIVETADDAYNNDLGFDFYVISMANWMEPTVNQ